MLKSSILALFAPLVLSAQVAVSLDRVNMLYAGLVNPITVADSEIPDSNLLLVPSMGQLRRTGLGQYDWTIFRRDTNFATLEIRNIAADTLIQTFQFRVGRIPVPTPVLGRNTTPQIARGEFCASRGIALILQKFDYDVKCSVLHFEAAYIPKDQDILVTKNSGARFNTQTYEWICKAKPGDTYRFFNIVYRCGCDPMVRYLSETLHFKIK